MMRGFDRAWMHACERVAMPAEHSYVPHMTAHPVTVREISGARLRIGPIEAIDGTPVVDIKSAG